MNILILGINGEIGNSILKEIYNINDMFYVTYSKKNPSIHFSNVKKIKLNFKNTIEIKNLKSFSKLDFDIIINNVGDSNPYKDVRLISINEIIKSLRINFIGPFNIMLHFIKKNLKKKKETKIINVSSNTLKFFGSKNNFPYFISKNCLDQSLLYLSKHFTEEKVKINIIRPGLIETNKSTKLKNYTKKNFLIRQKLVPTRKAGSPKDISKLVSFLMNKNSDFIIGQVISVSGGE